MTIEISKESFKGSGGVKKILAIGATALMASVALASPAWASVGDGRLLEVDYTNDFVLLEGYPEGEVTVEVLRSGVDGPIGTFTGTVVAGAGGEPSVLEINHAGDDPEAGVNDCWQDGTPNIRPGDQVRVTGTGIDDYTFVRNLDYEDVDGRILGVATGNELENGSFVNTPISLASSDPDAEPPTLDARRVGGTVGSRGTISELSPSGAFDAPLAGQGGEVSLQYINVTDDGGEESTVAGPFDATPPDLGCGPEVNDPNPGAFADVTPPDAPTVPDLAAASDDGASNTDNKTSVATPTFTGSSESRSTVELLVDGNVVGSGSTVGGKYSIETSAIGVGVHNVTARAKDAANNVSAPSGALSMEVLDVVPPAAPSLDLVAASDTGSSNADNRTNDATPTFAGRTEAGASVRILVDGVLRGTGTANASGNYSITTSALANGARSVVAEARDAAGNASRSAALTVNVDLIRPSVVARTPAVNATGRAVTTNATATFSEPVVGTSAASFTLKRGTIGVTSAVTYNAANRTATLNPNANLLRNTLYTAALTGGIRDQAGNTLAPVSWSFRTVR
ncbi:hypothetical protein GBA65_13555 [Rubrobacter marinus]|uniref:Ig-like domain (Group 3) n=1 Tax=Rubrobacter marinus TaxID=2653852 RepID=A0A6G8PZ05_9ACTN|nr:Ig-like domain-containing protein [Rubrobacter marinus]QIN79367.1 hypothetical protein GBA65_13555 [Rubrobacter marinus]